MAYGMFTRYLGEVCNKVIKMFFQELTFAHGIHHYPWDFPIVNALRKKCLTDIIQLLTYVEVDMECY